MRDYLVVTRGVDPVALEDARMLQMTRGFNPMPSDDGQRDRSSDMLFAVAYVTFQELATRVSHRNTGRACDDPVADRMLGRVAADENLHMLFYRNIMAGALDLTPDQAIKAIHSVLTLFQMPGATMPGFRRNAVLMAKAGIYDLPQHLADVVAPVLRKWNIFERNDFGPEGEKTRNELAAFIGDLTVKVERFERTRERALARESWVVA
jgi:acyl-[acyl-carrier-protein] desaturase